VRGELAAYDVSVYRLAALKGIFTKIVSENVSYVNAPLFAEQRGIETRLIVEADSPLYRNITILRGTLSDGTVLEVAGTLAGTRMVPKIVGINGYEIEVPIEKHHIVMRYADRPGIVAIYGQKLGRRASTSPVCSSLSPTPRAAPLGAHGRPARAGRDPRRHATGDRRRPLPSAGDRRGLTRRGAGATTSSSRHARAAGSAHQRLGERGGSAARGQRTARSTRATSAFSASPRGPVRDRSARQGVVEVQAVADEHHEIERRALGGVGTQRVGPLLPHLPQCLGGVALPPCARREVARMTRSIGSFDMTDECR
jgi:hypothetical protein